MSGFLRLFSNQIVHDVRNGELNPLTYFLCCNFLFFLYLWILSPSCIFSFPLLEVLYMVFHLFLFFMFLITWANLVIDFLCRISKLILLGWRLSLIKLYLWSFKLEPSEIWLWSSTVTNKYHGLTMATHFEGGFSNGKSRKAWVLCHGIWQC